MRLFEIEADYRPHNTNKPHYYVMAKSKSDAKRRFKSRITWLDIYGCEEVVDEVLAAEIQDNPDKYIFF